MIAYRIHSLTHTYLHCNVYGIIKKNLYSSCTTNKRHCLRMVLKEMWLVDQPIKKWLVTSEMYNYMLYNKSKEFKVFNHLCSKFVLLLLFFSSLSLLLLFQFIANMCKVDHLHFMVSFVLTLIF